MLATLEDLDEAALIQILTEPKNALVKQYQRLFEMEDVELTFHEDALTAIARKAPSSARPAPAACARSWKAILLDTMFELPALEGVEEVVISDRRWWKAAPGRSTSIPSGQEKKGIVSA